MEQEQSSSLPSDRLTVMQLHVEAQSLKDSSAVKGSVRDYPEHYNHHLMSTSAIFEVTGPRADYIQAASCIEYSQNYSASEATAVIDKLAAESYQPEYTGAPDEFVQSLAHLKAGSSSRVVMTRGRYEVATIVGEPNADGGLHLFGTGKGSRVCFSEHDIKNGAATHASGPRVVPPVGI